ncbi:MAG: DUF6524 family protein [bacterium]
MAVSAFSTGNFMIRFAAAAVLIFASFNPSGYSWYHWFMDAENKFTPALVVSGLVLLIGWVIYLKATFESLGGLGSILAATFFGALLWTLFYYDILSLENTTALTYVVLAMLAAFLAVGISWSHIHRRMTGQVDVDEADIN